ncbi:MAG: CDP-6-deoxy-delta-3,4-glucoseen reductase [Methylobacillus sp.]|jgi:CDP-4-dehydro-6-deoxyglucose reductase|nr:CDP-6-deoxy-delta-3,4-glucoseen reductase [Methylobacillus sp.]
MSFRVTLQPSGHEFSVQAGETVLSAALEAGYNIPYGCRNGACGACKGDVLQGRVEHGEHQEKVLTKEEEASGKALFCCARPLSDLAIMCREVTTGNAIRPRIMPCRVQKLDHVAHDVIVMYLKLPSNERLQFLAGQYIEFLLADGKRRAFSIANAPHNDDVLELHLRLIPGGQFTEYVFREMKEKTILRLEGPMGSFYLREESEKPVIFVAGGTGFAPVKGIIEHALHHKMQRKMTLYRGALALRDLYLPDLPEKWQQENGVDYIPVLSEPQPEDAWQGRTGYVHLAVLQDHPDLSGYQVYCCGAPAMVEAAHRDFTAAGLPPEEFFSDAFTFAPPSPAKATA